MREIKKLSIIGLGAIGAIYASKIHEMDGEMLRVIANKERARRYGEEGLKINGNHYHFNCIDPEEKTEPADLLIVSVKFHHLDQTIKDIRNHVGPDTIILSLLNGISSEEILAKEYGMDNILYGICVGIDAVRTEEEIKCSSIGEIHFGERVNKTYSPNVLAVKNLFDRAGIPYEIPEDILRALWWKFMANVGINQSSAVLRAPYRVFQEIKEIRDLMESAMKEVIALSQQVGANLVDEDIKAFTDLLGNFAPEGKTSMLQDIEAGRKTEVEMFAGVVCQLGDKYGIATPVNRTLFNMIRTLEEMNS